MEGERQGVSGSLGDKRMRIWPVAVFGLALLVAVPALAQPGAADAKFQALYKREWAWRKVEFPEREREGSRLPDHFPLVDPANQARRLAYWQAVRKELAAIPEASLSPAEAVNYEVYADQIDTLIAQQK